MLEEGEKERSVRESADVDINVRIHELECLGELSFEALGKAEEVATEAEA